MRTMKILSIGILWSIGLALPARASPVQDQGPYRDPYRDTAQDGDARFFHDDLSPYGQWQDVDDYGQAWVPRVSRDWRPYTAGHWTWTDDYGWLWASDEPYGWAVYHYGRWHQSPRHGWAWIPGNDWAPAWVSFRFGGGYAGWAPLPPSVGWDSGVGFRVGAVDMDRYVDPRAYCFVQERRFLDPVQRNVFSRDRNDRIIHETQNVTNYQVMGNRVANRGIAVERIQRATGRPVPRTRIVEVDTVAAARHGRAARNEVPVFRPVVRGTNDRVVATGKATPEPRPIVNPRDLERQRQAESKQEAVRQREAAQQQQAQAHQDAVKKRQTEQHQQAQAHQDAVKQRQAEQQQAHQDAVKQRQTEQQHQAEARRQADATHRVEAQQQAQQQRELAQKQREERQAAERQARADREKAQQKPKDKAKDKPKDKPKEDPKDNQ
jgi:hypothetical protein